MGAGELPQTATLVYELINCGKSSCGTCHGKDRKHGPYWYAKWETGGRNKAKMHAEYIGKAPATATPEELRAKWEARQARKAGTGSAGSTNGSTTGSTGGKRSSAGSTSGSAGSTSGSAGRSSSAGSTSGSAGSTSGSADADCFGKGRPLDKDFATIGAKKGATFAEAKAAYLQAIQKAHPDKGGSDEQAKCVNAAWERIKRFYKKK